MRCKGCGQELGNARIYCPMCGVDNSPEISGYRKILPVLSVLIVLGLCGLLYLNAVNNEKRLVGTYGALGYEDVYQFVFMKDGNCIYHVYNQEYNGNFYYQKGKFIIKVNGEIYTVTKSKEDIVIEGGIFREGFWFVNMEYKTSGLEVVEFSLRDEDGNIIISNYDLKSIGTRMADVGNSRYGVEVQFTDEGRERLENVVNDMIIKSKTGNVYLYAFYDNQSIGMLDFSLSYGKNLSSLYIHFNTQEKADKFADTIIH